MNDVFISYKRDDEVRVGRLVQALEAAGLSVWWDRGLAGGEPWRAAIDGALGVAKSAVVVWTRDSTGPEGGFVKDEASRAAKRAVLVPVLFDRVDPPLGFGELQAIDLTHWKGSPRDPFFQDLVAALRAKMAGQPVPPPLGPMRRLRRRLGWAGAVSALTATAAAFATNTLNLQTQACALPLAQPTLSDACAILGLGGRPAREERLAWAALPAGSCEAVREHLRRFPDGALRGTAMAVLGARRLTSTTTWVPAQRPLRLLVGRDVVASGNEAQAREAALQRGRAKAANLCGDFANSGSVRVGPAQVEAQEWTCERLSRGVVCGFEGRAVCALEEAAVSEAETCGASPVP